MFRLAKPEWLEGLLSHLNWDIFQWQIYVGDTIETGIDWVIDWINSLIEWAQDIGAWWEDFRQEVLDAFNIISDIIGLLIDNPIEYLKEVFETYILPWALEHVPFFATIYNWYLSFRAELELFFDNPVTYLTDKFETYILPWAQEHIPWIVTVYHWFLDFKDELEAFFSDPRGYFESLISAIKGELGLLFSDPMGYLLQRFEEYILPWAQEHIPFIATLYFWYTEAWDKITNFFTTELWDDVIGFFSDPVEFIWNKVSEWFLGPEG